MNIGFDPNRTAMSLLEWRELHYRGTKAPCVRTLKKWIDDESDEDFVGYNKGSMYFIYIDAKENDEDMKILSELGLVA